MIQIEGSAIPNNPVARRRDVPGCARKRASTTVKPFGFTVTTTLTVWDTLPLVPTTSTAYVPVSVPEGAEKFITELAEPPATKVTVEGLNETTSPLGKTVAENVTLPANPF